MDAQSMGAPQSAPDAVFTQKKLALENRIRNGAGWFFWIGALSLVDTTFFLAGHTWSFMIGLGITQVIDVTMSVVAEDLGQTGATIARLIGLVGDFIIIGIFLGLGVLGRRRFRWAMIVGVILYALDAVLFLLFKDFIDLLFHALVLYCLWRGLQATDQLRALEKAEYAKSVGIS